MKYDKPYLLPDTDVNKWEETKTDNTQAENVNRKSKSCIKI